jgi:hypothetical protein
MMEKTISFVGEKSSYGTKSDPMEITWEGEALSVWIEGTLPGNDYNIDGTFGCRLSRSDAERLRVWLTEALR